MSSWKKASKVNQKTHWERHQPEKRSHLGILEKHKDYVKRARDYQRKQNVIKKLKEAALNKNPDEFYMHMVNSQVVDGIHLEKKKEESEDTIEQKKLMENRSLTYVNMMYTVEQKKVEKMKSELHIVDFTNKVKANHIFFTEDDNGKKKNKKSMEIVASSSCNEEDSKFSGVHPELVDNRTNRLTVEDLARIDLPNLTYGTCRKLQKLKLKRYKELARRIDRKQQLNIVHRKMEIQQCLKNTNKVEKPKLLKQGSKTSAPVYEWKYERKR